MTTEKPSYARVRYLDALALSWNMYQAEVHAAAERRAARDDKLWEKYEQETAEEKAVQAQPSGEKTGI